MFRGALVAGLALVGLVSFGCSGGGGRDDLGSQGAYTRAASVGSIDIEATWLGADAETRDELADYPPDRFLLLEVSLDTHAGDLGSVDMVEAATVETDEEFLEPEAWIASSDESHHRSGVLVFSRRDLAPPVKLTLVLEASTAELEWEEVR